jgi:hypothetical protein
MKFMLMIVNDERQELSQTAAEVDALIAQHRQFSSALREAGALVASHRLRPSSEEAVITYHGHGCTVTDGPFAETREAIGGFYLIDCASREAAIEWAKRLPLSPFSAIEVRPARTGAQWRGPTEGARYLVMFVANREQPLSRDAVFDAIDNHYELSLELAAQGKFVGSRALEPSLAAVTVRPQNGTRTIVDGPFAETKEFVAGYFVISSDSRAEAVEWAAKLGRGSHAVIVRPVWEPAAGRS